MSLSLIVDQREKPEVKNIIREYCTNAASIEICTQDVGDFQIRDAEGQILVVLERKTCSDMAASINDGRYREQKVRLLNTQAPYRGYILEGIYPETGISFPGRGKRRVVKSDTYRSIILGLTIRDSLLVYQTEDLVNTARLINQILKKLPDYLDKPDHDLTSYQSSLVQCVSTVKKDNMTPKLCFAAMLAQIPGVSLKLAKLITQRYPSWDRLLQASSLELAEINTGERRLGQVLAERITEYLHPKPTKISIIKK